MGNTCIPVADSCLYMAKPIQYFKVKKKKKNLGNFFALCLCVLEKIHVFSKNCLSIDTICKLFTLNIKYELLII